MPFRCMRGGGSLHAFLAMELYKRVLSTRNITQSLRVRIYKIIIIRPMERDLMMCKTKIMRKICGLRYENDNWGKVKCMIN